MDIRQLKYFVAVYEQRSISAAARQCCVAQPSLSAALLQLEQELGVSLFLRLPKGVTPTEEGDKLYGHAGKLLAQLASLKASFQAPAAKVRFRLGLIRALGVERMSALLREFSQQVPGLELHLVEPDAPCDARIITPAQQQGGEVLQPIWRDRYLLALPPAWPLSLQSQLTLDDFQDLPLIKRTPCDAWDLLYPQLSRLNIALVPDFDNLLERSDVALKPIAGLQLERTIALAYRSDNAHPALPVLQQLCSQSSAL